LREPLPLPVGMLVGLRAKVNQYFGLLYADGMNGTLKEAVAGVQLLYPGTLRKSTQQLEPLHRYRFRNRL
jgi:hypothetical protein